MTSQVLVYKYQNFIVNGIVYVSIQSLYFLQEKLGAKFET